MNLKFTIASVLVSFCLAGLLTACNNETNEDATDNTITAPAIPNIAYQVIEWYPHDTAAFTQGLIWHDGFLYEGTGQLGQSNLRKVALNTGKVLVQKNNAPDVFGEGITLLNGKIYQLSWQNRKGFIYNAETLQLEKEFPLNTEGWGLTHNGSQLIVSDGSSNLYFLDPNTLQETGRIGVTDNYGYVGDLNELEFVDGFVYANKWRTDYILKINPDNGKVVGRLDFGQLKNAVKQELVYPDDAVLNGIAYDSAKRLFYLTGKNWPRVFAVSLQ